MPRQKGKTRSPQRSPTGHEWAAERFGAVLRQWRLRRKLSPEQLAARAGVARMSVVNIERGKSDPRFETQQRLARGLGIRLSVLVIQTERATGAPARPPSRRA